MGVSPFLRTIVLPFFLTTAAAAGVRGRNDSSANPSSSCDELLDMAIGASDGPAHEGRCFSYGFMLKGGKCLQDSADCNDFGEPTHQGGESFVVVSRIHDSSKIYYQEYLQEGKYFQISAPQDSVEILPQEYNISRYASNDLSVENLIQTMIVKAPCTETPPILDGPIQFIFSAMTPPTRRWKVALASLASTESWTLEWIKSSREDTSWSRDLTLQGQVIKSIEISLEEDGTQQDTEQLQFTAQLVSNSGQRCTIAREWDGTESKS